MSELNKLGWHFSRNTNRMHVKLPYEEALDSDDATIKATLGREKIQNSLDACVDTQKPVQMSFNWISFENESFFLPYINQLIPKLKSMDKVYDENNVDPANPSFLVVEDFNTSGLTGKFDPKGIEQDEPNNYYGYFYKLGYSGKSKQDSTSGGRRGIGRAVGAIASSINSMFIISKRNDDKKTFLKGLCLGKRFNENDTSYDGYGYYDLYKGEDELSEPIIEQNSIKMLADKLGIDRTNHFGTSTIIPYPDKSLDYESVANEILKNYYVVISQGKLEIKISYKDQNNSEETIFNKDNILDELERKNLNEEHQYLKNFIKPCFEILDNHNHVLEATASSDGKITKEDFNENELEKIRDLYNEKKIINIKAKIKLKPKEFKGEPTQPFYSQETFVNFFIQKQDSDINSKAYYQRGLMPLMGEGTNFYANSYGFMYAYDAPAVSFIAASEGTNHLKINTSEPDLRNNYRIPYNIQARFIKFGLTQLLDLMLLVDEQEDTDFEKEFFTIIDEDNQNENIIKPVENNDEDEEVQEDEEEKPIFPPFEPPPGGKGKPIIISRLTSKKGYKIKANKNFDNISSLFPLEINFKCAYSEYGRKKSFSYHEDLDFDLKNNKKIKIDLKNSNIIEKYSNNINFKLENENFEISIYDFYSKFEVDVEIELL